jgi:pimeloyl-ACP methyl ester carboxylesterase
MTRRPFAVPVAGGQIVGWVQGEGAPVLLLHGGPALPYEYLDGLTDELGDGVAVAAFQQRGLAPSVADGPFDFETYVADTAAVLDHLGWERAWLVGHSWGGHLAVQLADRMPTRWFGVLPVDPLGAYGDGGAEEFEKEMFARTPEADRARAEELDAAAMAGEGTMAGALESLRLVWPAYFTDPANILPMQIDRMGLEAFAATWEAVLADLPRLAAALPTIDVPFTFVHGECSPLPVSASGESVAQLPDAELVVVPGAGHFVWFEAPGSVRAALDQLIDRTQRRSAAG